jgi:predicted amidohydrolase YtcJ
MLIRDAEIWGHGRADLRIADGAVAAIGPLAATPGEQVIDAAGGALLPGLHDHHLHLAGLAVRAASLWCGPPEVTSQDELAALLSTPGDGWLRGIGYHDSIMGLPDRHELDTLMPDRPLRLQHRSGRMWLLNSLALSLLLENAEPPPGLERDEHGFTGRLFEEDAWLRAALRSQPPDFAAVSAQLASHGLTGITDMTPGNDAAIAGHFTAQMQTGALAQHCLLAGTLALADAPGGPWQLGPAKLHLLEAAFPPFDETAAFIAAAHRQGRAVAIHCVSEVELVFALAALETAGTARGDRIEHASVASPDLVRRIASLDLAVCVQPHFIEERGDRYLLDVETRHIADLYRLRSFADAGVSLAGGSDAPFGGADPWAAMRAAVSRMTRAGVTMDAGEALTPEEALGLFLAEPADLSRQRAITVGGPADLCLLDRPWSSARDRLLAGDVMATLVSGRIVHDRVDKPPVQRGPRAQPPA